MDETLAVIDTKTHHLDPLPWRAYCPAAEKVLSRQPSAINSSRVKRCSRELCHLTLNPLGKQPMSSDQAEEFI